MNEIQASINRWQNETFTHQQTITGLLNHLTKEVIELLDKPTSEEAADCAILLFGLAGRMGFDLLDEVAKKMAINEVRSWGEPDEEGVIEHTERVEEKGSQEESDGD